jgi:uncharacterized protein (DUF849 family)
MDVIGFLCVSLGGSTVQLHVVLCSRRACACSEIEINSKNGDRVFRRTTEEQSSVVYYIRERGLSAKDIHKEMFPLYFGKFLSCKAVHRLIEKRDISFADDEEIETEMRKWL